MSDSQTSIALQMKFEYEPLDLTKQQIRLLTLHSALSKRDPIECSLEAFDANSCPEYVALSYVWGPPSPTNVILVNQRSFTVRQNLFDFLLAYRNDSKNTHYVWIDQICISQAHNGERNHQVQLMSVIYTNSLWTLSWLGWENQERAFQFVSLCRSKETDTSVQFFEYAARTESAQNIISGNYFRRLWIIQEILLAPAVCILWGDVWMDFGIIMSHAAETPTILLQEHSTHGLIHAVQESSRSFSLIECLNWFSGHECQDPRDKLYGLTGIVREELIVDYTKTAVEVFLDVILALAKSGTLFYYSKSRGLADMWHIFHSLLQQMGLGEHAVAFENLWLDLRDIHKEANPRQWNHSRERYRVPRTCIEHWRVSSEWADDVEGDLDDKECVIPFSAIGFAPGKNPMLGKWWYTWKGASWFYVVGDWQAKDLPNMTRWNPWRGQFEYEEYYGL